MSRTIQWCALALFIITATSADAGSWSLGTHLSASLVRTGEANDGSTGIWAATSNVLGYQPALRAAWGDRLHQHDVLFDFGGLAIDQPGSSLSMAVMTLGYQHAFGEARFTPIVNVDAGAVRESGAQISWAPLFGLGVGVRHLIRQDHGALRIEGRWDQAGTDHTIGRPRLDSLGVRAGFDLWL